jgi:hypothetical protein
MFADEPQNRNMQGKTHFHIADYSAFCIPSGAARTVFGM